MPEILAMIQINHLTPTPAIIATGAISLIYLTSNDIFTLINYTGFVTWLAIGLGVACVPYLRWKEPNMERPIKVHLIWPFLYILGTIFVTIVPIIADPFSTGMGTLMILTGIPVYLLFIKWKNKPRFITNSSSNIVFQIKNKTKFFDSICVPTVKCTHLLQKFLVVVPSEKKK